MNSIMANINADFDTCDDVIQSCDTLLKSNFAKFHIYAKHQEELRLKFTATNNEYKILKTWLHIAYEDIITLKSEHGDLSKLYEMLFSNNFFEGFLQYANDQETLQVTFIRKMNECKDLMTKLNATNKSITSLKTKYHDLTQRYEVALENHSVKEFLDSTKQQESLRSKFIETLDECKCLKTCLDSAHEAILILKSELDEVTDRYKVLSKNNNVEEFLDCARKLEASSEGCKCSKPSADRVTHSNTVVEVDLSSNMELNMLEPEVDIKEIVGVSIKRDPQQSYLSENDDDPTVLENRITNEFDIAEVNLDNQIKHEPQELYLNESEDIVVVKQETPDEQYATFSTTADEFHLSSNNHFETDGLFEEKSVAAELLPETVENRDVFIKPEVPIESCILEQDRNESLECSGKLNSSIGGSLSIKTLFHPRFECVICGESFPKKTAMLAHMRTHKGNKSFHCDKCGKSFKTRSNQQKLLKCPVCDIINRSSSGCKEKRKLPHELFGPRCNICGRIYSSNRSLKEHISSVHDGQKSFKCPTCDKLFARKGDVKRHVLLHYPLSQKFFTCSFCDKSFNSADSKRRHERTLHEGDARFCCAHCDKRCNQKRDILNHIQMQHLPKREKEFQCTICGKLFARKNGLELHQYVHTSKRLFECSMCGKHFKNFKYRRQHELIVHAEDVRFRCAYCDKRFRYKDSLISHIQKFHKHHYLFK